MTNMLEMNKIRDIEFLSEKSLEFAVRSMHNMLKKSNGVVCWKYLYYHILKDMVGINNPLRLFNSRLRLVDSLQDNVFLSSKVSVEKVR